MDNGSEKTENITPTVAEETAGEPNVGAAEQTAEGEAPADNSGGEGAESEELSQTAESANESEFRVTVSELSEEELEKERKNLIKCLVFGAVSFVFLLFGYIEAYTGMIPNWFMRRSLNGGGIYEKLDFRWFYFLPLYITFAISIAAGVTAILFLRKQKIFSNDGKPQKSWLIQVIVTAAMSVLGVFASAATVIALTAILI